MGGISQPDDKACVRREFLARRRQVDRDALAGASDAACRHVVAAPAFDRARHLLAYAARDGEIDPTSVVDAATERGTPTYFPRVEEGGLAFRRARKADLEPGAYGVAEPRASAQLLPADARDVLVLVPGVAFDREGARIGSGKGFYDRALSHLPDATKLGMALDSQVVARLPQDPWDLRMDGIVTERGLAWTASVPRRHSGERA
jgi:5-formyltetrahydrofolate cyclo-ligase